MKLTTRKFLPDYWNMDCNCFPGKDDREVKLRRKIKKMASKARRQDDKAAVKEQRSL